MDIGFTPQEELFRQEFRQWLRDNLPPGWLDGKRDLPADAKELKQFLQSWNQKLYEGGWAGMSWPKEYGGRGASQVEQYIYDEELVLQECPPNVAVISQGFIGPTLMQWGTPEQKERYLAPILRGDEFWCQGFSEPDAGSDLVSLKTTAVDMGDHFLVNGQKVWTSFAHMADFCFLLVRTDPKAQQKHKGLSILIMDMKTPGIDLRPIHQISGESDFNEMFLTDVKIPKENLVGGLNKGWLVAMTLLSFERKSVTSVIRTDRFFPQVLEYCRTHTRNGIPLIKDAIIRDKIAQFYIEGEIAILNSYRGLTKQIKQGMLGPEASIDKIFAGELNKRMNSFVMELVGDDGLHEAEKYNELTSGGASFGLLDSFQGTMGGGTTEIQRNVVAERVLGLPRD